MKLTDEVQLIFKNKEDKKVTLTITVETLLENKTEDFFEILEDEHNPCTCTISESQNYCECQCIFDDYEIVELTFKSK